jgi:hypothetical protein
MAQIGNQHPDKLVPHWHAARQLTPAETETVGRIMAQHLPAHIADNEAMIGQWLDRLPPIPPRRADRLEWSMKLEDSHYMHNADMTQQHVSALKSAMRRGDMRTLLRLMTDSVPFTPRPKLGDLRPEWRRELQAIRDALETRIDDALEAAVAAKAAENA